MKFFTDWGFAPPNNRSTTWYLLFNDFDNLSWNTFRTIESPAMVNVEALVQPVLPRSTSVTLTGSFCFFGLLFSVDCSDLAKLFYEVTLWAICLLKWILFLVLFEIIFNYTIFQIWFYLLLLYAVSRNVWEFQNLSFSN